MQWLWQQKKWPNFEYNYSKLEEYEKYFHKNTGIIIGTVAHIDAKDWEAVKINILTQEAIATSKIEGELMQRESVQSSIRRQLGLQTNRIKIQPNEAGIAELIVEIYKSFSKKLSHKDLFLWHKMITNGRRDLDLIGNYRKHIEPMQIVSGNLKNTTVFYEAPPSEVIKKEMSQFIQWYNTHLNKLPVLLFAGIAHLYFEMIHPFEDGNGRIGRALVEKAISQKLKTPALNSFARLIDKDKKKYYTKMQSCNHDIDITEWLIYFSETILEAQEYSIKTVQFVIAKAKFFNKFKALLNERQEKVVIRIFEEGIEGFKGGLNANNYKTISKASESTVTRDLQELVAIQAVTKTGSLKNSRYFLNLDHLF